MKRSLLICFLISIIPFAFGQKVIFLHHSTGEGVYNEGDVPGWITSYNTGHGTGYQITERSFPNTPYPWENYPYDYWNLWVNNACDNTDPDIACLDKIAQDYDVIIFKHCFPGAGVLADDGNPQVGSEVKTLENYKLQYSALRDLMDTFPDNKFIVWTLAPLHRLATNASDAARAREFVDWVKTSWIAEDGKPHPNIYIFDFYGYAAESNPEPANGKVNCLRYEYEKDHSDSNSHPNVLANETIGPLFAEFIVNTIEETEPVSVGDAEQNFPSAEQLFWSPNPSSGNILIEMIQPAGRYHLDIIASNGAIVHQDVLRFTESSLPLDIGHLGNGVYMIRVYNDESNFQGKLVMAD
ncbi:MAG: T9SS type A sorting domain-containing protein [Bacteroidota bacterium]